MAEFEIDIDIQLPAIPTGFETPSVFGPKSIRLSVAGGPSIFQNLFAVALRAQWITDMNQWVEVYQAGVGWSTYSNAFNFGQWYTISWERSKAEAGALETLSIDGSPIWSYSNPIPWRDLDKMTFTALWTYGPIDQGPSAPGLAFPLPVGESGWCDTYHEKVGTITPVFNDNFTDGLMTDWRQIDDVFTARTWDDDTTKGVAGARYEYSPFSKIASSRIWRETVYKAPPAGTDKGELGDMDVGADGTMVHGYITPGGGKLEVDVYKPDGTLDSTIELVSSGQADASVGVVFHEGVWYVRTAGGGTRKKSRNPYVSGDWSNE